MAQDRTMILPPKTRSQRILYYWLPFVFYSLLIIYLSHQPHLDLGPSAPSDKVLHFCEYFGYAWLLIRIFFLYTIPYATWLTIGISTAWGISDELHQYFIPGRNCSFGDVVIDIVGAVCLVVLLTFLRKKRKFKT